MLIHIQALILQTSYHTFPFFTFGFPPLANQGHQHRPEGELIVFGFLGEGTQIAPR